jgi:pimeloyl-ACP methyl ester carboxylesterase
VSAHGTAGIADGCAPSRIDGASDALVLPFAGRGWPVIAPDYAGLGTEDVQGYGDNDDTGRSTLDAARALSALMPAGTLSGRIVMNGHSQGGGSVLSAQAMEPSYGAGGELALVIAFAPGWAIAREATGYRFPGVSTTFGGGAPAAIASLFLYAWGARELGLDRAGEVFGAAVRADVMAALERDCIFTLTSTIPAAAPTFGDLVDETLRTGIVSCADGGACTGTASQLWTFMGDNILMPAATGAPVLVLAGTNDTLATPRDVSCIAEHLRGAGVTPTVCVDTSTHFDIVPNTIGFAIDYASAMLSSADPPACPTTTTLPACL